MTQSHTVIFSFVGATWKLRPPASFAAAAAAVDDVVHDDVDDVVHDDVDDVVHDEVDDVVASPVNIHYSRGENQVVVSYIWGIRKLCIML